MMLNDEILHMGF